MAKYSFVFLQLAVVGISMLGVHSITEDEEMEILEILKPVVMGCINECGLTEEDLKNEKDDDMNPCVKKCILIKLGMLTESGKYDRESVKQQISTFVDNEEEAAKFQADLDNCFKGKEELMANGDDDKKVDLIFACLESIK